MATGLEALAGGVRRPTPQTLGRHVVDQLRLMILTRALAPGTHLVEAQLSTSFEVSRGPVRDALAQLQAEGLVESRRRGVFVRGLDTHDLHELYVVREAVEGAAIRLAVEAGADALGPVAHRLDELEAAARSGDHLAYARADLHFHTAFYAAAGNERLAAVWAQYEPTFRVLLELTNAEDRDLGPSLRSHQDLFDLVRSGDTDATLRALREHLQGSEHRMLVAYARDRADDRP